MTEQELIDLMESSNSEKEWNANCDIVKQKCNGYPSFWYKAIVIGGVMAETSAKWGGDDKIHITTHDLSTIEEIPKVS